MAASRLDRRLTPEQLTSIQMSLSRSAMAASAAAASNARQGGALPATQGTTLAADRTTVRNTFTAVPSTQQTSSIVPSSISSSSAVRSSTTIPLRSSTSITSTTSSTSTTPTTSSTPTVLTITTSATVTSSAASSTSATPLVSAADAGSSTSKSSMSTGAVVGVVLGVLIGVVALGSFIGFCYRKWANRGYKGDMPWRQIRDDDDITPYTMEKVDNTVDDYYGNASAPVIGSRRALTMARNNAFNSDGSLRPDSEYMYQNGNRAGVGAGPLPMDYGGYPDIVPAPATATYGVDAQGRPYHPHATQAPMAYGYQDQYPPVPPSARQLTGPGGPAHPYAQPDLKPVPLGRPAPPQSHVDLLQHETFSDESATALAYQDQYNPSSASSNNAWTGYTQDPLTEDDRSRIVMPTPNAARSAQQSRRITPPQPYRDSPPRDHALLAAPAYHASAPGIAISHDLPNLEPLSPLMTAFDLQRRSQPLPLYEDESSRQKALYGEVAKAAGVKEPITPITPAAHITESRSTEPMPHLPPPPINVTAPMEPYRHGRPLSPLTEVETPMSTAGREANPFDRPAVAGGTRTLLPPHSATSASTTGATAFPSAQYPPPSPGGMSVPGSVTDSPRRWSGPGTPAAATGRSITRTSSVFDQDDAYGGI